MTFDELCEAPGAVRWTMAVSGDITFISESIVDVRGIMAEEARIQAPDQIHPPSSLRVSLDYFEKFSRALIEGRVPEAFHADLEYFHRDGTTVLCQVMAVPVLGEGGEVIELAGVSVPV
jgi:hypothetical protein